MNVYVLSTLAKRNIYVCVLLSSNHDFIFALFVSCPLCFLHILRYSIIGFTMCCRSHDMQPVIFALNEFAGATITLSTQLAKATFVRLRQDLVDGGFCMGRTTS